MTLTVDWAARIVNSDVSITDIVAFREEVRILEASEIGQLYPPIITYKKVDSGGGSFLHFVDIINSYQMQFPIAGNYQMLGNINGDIVPVAGVYVERLKGVAFVTGPSTGGGSGLFDLTDRATLHEINSNTK